MNREYGIRLNSSAFHSDRLNTLLQVSRCALTNLYDISGRRPIYENPISRVNAGMTVMISFIHSPILNPFIRRVNLIVSSSTRYWFLKSILKCANKQRGVLFNCTYTAGGITDSTMTDGMKSNCSFFNLANISLIFSIWIIKHLRVILISMYNTPQDSKGRFQNS